MHNLSNQDSDQSSVHSTSNCTSTCVSLWDSNGSNIPQFSYSKSMEMMTDQCELDMNKMNLLRHKLSEQDSSSTQSTSHSHQEVLGTRIENLHQQYVSPQSGDHNIYDKPVEGHMKSVLSLGTPEVALHHQKNDYSHSIAFVPYPFANPYSGVVASYGSHAIIHPQMVGMVTPARVPLPLEPAAEEPIYVNAKQYHGILRRRQLRAKMEAQNKIVKDRKPYLHESRHLHAMKRARGSGGRFLNKTKAQESVSAGSTADENVRGTTLLQLGGDGRGGFQLKSDVLSSDNAKMPTSTTPTSSEITTVSNDGGTFQIEEHQIRFSTDFHSHVMSTMQGGGGMVRSGSQQRVPAMR